MLVYGHRSFPLRPAAFLRDFCSRLERLPGTPDHDELISLLVDFGEADAAVTDFLQRDYDDMRPELATWRDALLAIASAVCASWKDDPEGVSRAVSDALTHAGVLTRMNLPDLVEARVAEGFAQYALYPEQYIVATEDFVRATQPTRVTCIGLRSIGSTLAAVVTASLTRSAVPVELHSVRPRGDPWDRRLVLSARLQDTIRGNGSNHFVIVDEGPGISGSSFAAAVDAVVAIGVPADRIILFPSWRAPAEALRSDRARAIWGSLRQFVGSFESTVVDRGVLGPAARLDDFSAGKWRERLFGEGDSSWPAVQPQHERRKYRCKDRDRGRTTLLRFAGLGRHGTAKLSRARMLADAGFGPPTDGLAHGFLHRAWIEGQPRLRLAGNAAASRMAAYLAFERQKFVTGNRARVSDLIEMIRINLADDGGRLDTRNLASSFQADSPSLASDSMLAAAEQFDEPEIALDGRLLPHDWIDCGDRLVKVDGIDHHADDFLPGCRDCAWDVAGALVEGDFDPDSARTLLDEYTRLSGDATIRMRLPFYLLAYAAYRLGYVTMAADTLGETPDGHRFRQAASRYRRSLAGRGRSSDRSRRC